MDPDRVNFLTNTLVDADVETGVGDLPVWLRDVLERALTASGIAGFRGNAKSASQDAIDSLRELALSDLKEKECAICYEPYVEADASKPAAPPKTVLQPKKTENRYSKRAQPVELLDKFNDPALFMPTDEICHYSRYPMRNLTTLSPTTLEEAFPGYKPARPSKKEEEAPHTPVKMPSCDHVFGKSCIIEWLKSNVSCPLCREEVEAKQNDARSKRMSQIRASMFHNFNDAEDVVDHLANHSTDVFNPYRRPFNPSITPLTDSFMHQDWATPYNLSLARTQSREPEIILPRRFPFPERGDHSPEPPLGFHVFDVSRLASVPRQTTPRGTTTPAARRAPTAPAAAAPPAPPAGASPTATNRSASASPSTGTTTPQARSGGPERRRTTGRTHPYARRE